jgi:hypothetical protein
MRIYSPNQMSATRVSPRTTSMFSSLIRCDGRLKLADPPTTSGSSPSGSPQR